MSDISTIEWNRRDAAPPAVAILGTALYLAYSAAFMPMWGLWAISLCGGVAYVAALVLFKRKFRTNREAQAIPVPVAVHVPVLKEADAHEARHKRAPRRKA